MCRQRPAHACRWARWSPNIMRGGRRAGPLSSCPLDKTSSATASAGKKGPHFDLSV